MAGVPFGSRSAASFRVVVPCRSGRALDADERALDALLTRPLRSPSRPWRKEAACAGCGSQQEVSNVSSSSVHGDAPKIVDGGVRDGGAEGVLDAPGVVLVTTHLYTSFPAGRSRSQLKRSPGTHPARSSSTSGRASSLVSGSGGTLCVEGQSVGDTGCDATDELSGHNVWPAATVHARARSYRRPWPCAVVPSSWPCAVVPSSPAGSRVETDGGRAAWLAFVSALSRSKERAGDTTFWPRALFRESGCVSPRGRGWSGEDVPAARDLGRLWTVRCVGAVLGHRVECS